jgi:hypothetical protein
VAREVDPEWLIGGREARRIVIAEYDPAWPRRFDTERAEIWLNASSLLAGAKILLGVDPKKDYKDIVADVDLR